MQGTLCFRQIKAPFTVENIECKLAHALWANVIRNQYILVKVILAIEGPLRFPFQSVMPAGIMHEIVDQVPHYHDTSNCSVLGI